MKLKKGERHFGNHDKYKEYLFTIFNNLLDQYKVDLVWWDFSQPKFQGDYSWGGNSFDEEFNWGRVTRKGEDKLYLILYSKPENGIIELPCSFEKKMVKAHMLHNKESIKTTQLKAQNKCLIDVSSICIEQTPVVIKLKWKL